MAKRNFILRTARSIFEKFGYENIETPAIENLETLTGKYGGEGEKLLYKVRGGLVSGTDETGEKKGLRYDLAVPLARYVAQHRHELQFPFKRYQIQPVWRADRPQKNRYREFWQCDADVIGSNSPLNETELLLMIDEFFEELRIPVTVKLNHRDILKDTASFFNIKNRFSEFVTELDKKEKIGWEGVAKNLSEKALASKMLTEEKLSRYFATLPCDHAALKSILSAVEEVNKRAREKIHFDASLARGLDYYTGSVIEVVFSGNTGGVSICGGGRYDDLTGAFGLPGVSGVGISFGVDRICDVMEEHALFPDATVEQGMRLLFVNFGEEEALHCAKMLRHVRKAGIPAALYPDALKLGKQLAYASARKIPFVGIVGSDEIRDKKITLRDMKTGEQKTVTFEEMMERLGRAMR